MAEAVLSQISGDFLECTICLEPYKDPKILPCVHTFCKGCLEKFVAKQSKVKDRFPCPTCRIETVLPEGGVAGLKNNFFVLSLRDTVDAHKSLVSKEDDNVTCDNCEEHVANFGCVVCEEFLCDDCGRVHRRGKRTRDHEVIGVAELKEQLITKTSSVKSRSLPMCPKHEDEKLKFYCETCQSPICRDCTVLQHKDHKYDLLAGVVSDVRAKIKNNLEAARPKIEEYRDAASVTATKQAELDTRSKKAADDIDAAAEEEIKYYTGLVRRKQTELKEKLAAVTAARSKQLSATADSVESTLGCLSSTVDFSQKVVEHGSGFDVMNVYCDVTARLESLLKGPTPDIPDDISYVRFEPRAERKETEIILGDFVGMYPVRGGFVGEDAFYVRSRFSRLGGRICLGLEGVSGIEERNIIAVVSRVGVDGTHGNPARYADFRNQRFFLPGCCFKFTTLGASGRLGPTTLGTHYRGQDHEHLVTLHDGIQHFTVPGTGTYNIAAAGAAAGWGVRNPKSARGRGAVLRGTFNLKQGETLKIMVGQESAENKGHYGVGGGGGTFVTRGDNTPLIIAGGGEGRGCYRPISPCVTGLGGSNGRGATEWKGDGMGGGGGGLLTDGGSSKRFGGDSCQHGGEGGKAFVNGGFGGRGERNNADAAVGEGGTQGEAGGRVLTQMVEEEAARLTPVLTRAVRMGQTTDPACITALPRDALASQARGAAAAGYITPNDQKEIAESNTERYERRGGTDMNGLNPCTGKDRRTGKISRLIDPYLTGPYATGQFTCPCSNCQREAVYLRLDSEDVTTIEHMQKHPALYSSLTGLYATGQFTCPCSNCQREAVYLLLDSKDVTTIEHMQKHPALYSSLTGLYATGQFTCPRSNRYDKRYESAGLEKAIILIGDSVKLLTCVIRFVSGPIRHLVGLETGMTKRVVCETGDTSAAPCRYLQTPAGRDVFGNLLGFRPADVWWRPGQGRTGWIIAVKTVCTGLTSL
ncbi:hypothetical protein Bbelb_238320 [Branchiostoma belcheri]|nr:hypothetical protein Bbelb_238320 [Branchiostoma belcheri]